MNGRNEDQALDALIAIALRAGINNAVTDAEIEQHMHDPQLNAQEDAAFNAWKQGSVSRLLGKPAKASITKNTVNEELFAAMNRMNTQDKHDPVTEEELERLRKKLLGEADS